MPDSNRPSHIEQLKQKLNPQEKNIPRTTHPIPPKTIQQKFHSELAFTSFILGIFGLILPLFSPLAIIFGIAGLMQIQREHLEGKNFAILGIILGFIGIVIILIAIIFGINFLQNYLFRMGSLDTLVGNAYKSA